MRLSKEYQLPHTVNIKARAIRRYVVELSSSNIGLMIKPEFDKEVKQMDQLIDRPTIAPDYKPLIDEQMRKIAHLADFHLPKVDAASHHVILFLI